MDEPVDMLVKLVLLFSGIFLLISCLTFYMNCVNARNTLNAVVEYIEVNPTEVFDATLVNDYCADKNVACAWTTGSSDIGVEGNAGLNRYEVSVSFNHWFAWISLNRSITFTALTRIVDY